MSPQRLTGGGSAGSASQDGAKREAQPTPVQLNWLRQGLSQPGGKLPLFTGEGQRIDKRTVRACIAHGWAEPWVANPIKPDWEVCKLSAAGRRLFG